MAIKRAFETGTFNFVGQEATQFPQQLWKVDQLNIEDQNWWECNPIIRIDVSNNEITEIPEEILALPDVSQIKTLEVIYLNNNRLKTVPCLG